MWIIAALLGAVWRRWFGDERPSWAHPGFRATQVVVGMAVLFGLGLLTGESHWRAAVDAGLAIGWLTLPIKVSLFGSTQFWRWLDGHVSLRSRFRWLDGYTTKAELTTGAVVWSAAILI